MIFRQYFKLTGLINQIAYDSGLTSTPTEKKRLLSVGLVVSDILDNQVQGYHEKAKVFDIPDRLIDEEDATGSINKAKPGARISEIEIGQEIPIGEVFKVAIKCGAVAEDVYGCYNYELIA